MTNLTKKAVDERGVAIDAGEQAMVAQRALYLGMLAFGVTASWRLQPHETLAYHAGAAIGFFLLPYVVGKIVGVVAARSWRAPAHRWTMLALAVFSAYLYFWDV